MMATVAAAAVPGYLASWCGMMATVATAAVATVECWRGQMHRQEYYKETLIPLSY